MKIVCDKCDYVIDRDNYIDGKIVEEYKNIFGTFCPNCKKIIKSQKKPFENKSKENKMKILREEMIKKLRKNIKGEI